MPSIKNYVAPKTQIANFASRIYDGTYGDFVCYNNKGFQ
jgi:hypothetical protein